MIAGLAVAFGYACAPGVTTWRPRANFNVISREDLLATHFRNAYEAVEALHSNWLLLRPNSFLAQGQVLVYMDNVRLGGISELRTISLMPIEYMEYFDAVQATTRWGVGHTQGVIYISTHPESSAGGGMR